MGRKSKKSGIQLPRMLRLKQDFKCSSISDIPDAIDSAFEEVEDLPQFPQGEEIAIAVGSRGIRNIPLIIRETVRRLKQVGGKPFVVPAMGSHGGATAEGQRRILENLGITSQTVGAPIRSSMEVITLGRTADGILIYVDRLACEAAGIVLVNRIKPHTDFVGEIESGTMKLAVIGLGKQKGADYYHRIILEKGYIPVIRAVAKEIFNKLNILFAIQVVENQNDETSIIKCTSSHKIEEVETSLLIEAKKMFPSLPFDQIDLLIIDEMGKEISGTGIDPNVTGRNVALSSQAPVRPLVSRIFVRDLTQASEGSAVGVGNADFVSKKLVEKIDPQTTAVNCITGCAPEHGRIPLTFDNDKQAIQAAFACIRPVALNEMRIVYIRNTLSLGEMLASEALEDVIFQRDDIAVVDPNVPLTFDHEDNLQSPFGTNTGSQSDQGSPGHYGSP
jgi:hypothetical protein